MDCKTCRAQLDAYPELTIETRKEIDAHLQQCPACAAAFAEAEALRAVLSALQPQAPDFITPAMAQLRSERKQKRGRGRAWVAAVCAAAACLAVMLTLPRMLPGGMGARKADEAEYVTEGAAYTEYSTTAEDVVEECEEAYSSEETKEEPMETGANALEVTVEVQHMHDGQGACSIDDVKLALQNAGFRLSDTAAQEGSSVVLQLYCGKTVAEKQLCMTGGHKAYRVWELYEGEDPKVSAAYIKSDAQQVLLQLYGEFSGEQLTALSRALSQAMRE